MTEIEIKEKLYSSCLSYIKQKQSQLQDAINSTQQSLSSESKSTAGDKHDTGRAMMHLELEKKGLQIQQLEKLSRVMHQFLPNQIHQNVDLGSVVKTNQGNFYISISAGIFEVAGENFYCISMASPLAQNLKKHSAHSQFSFLNKTYTINHIF